MKRLAIWPLLLVSISCGGGGAHPGGQDADASSSTDAGAADSLPPEAKKPNEDASPESADASCGDRPCPISPDVIKGSPAARCEVVVATSLISLANTNSGTIQSFPAPRGTPDPLAQYFLNAMGEDHPYQLVARDGALFWLAGVTIRALRKEPMSLTPFSVVTVDEGIQVMTAAPDGRTLYFASGGIIQKVAADAPDGGAPIVVATEDEGTMPTSLAISPNGDFLVLAGRTFVDVIELGGATPARCGRADGGAPDHCRRIGHARAEQVVVGVGRAYWRSGALVSSNDLATGGTARNDALYQAPVVGLAFGNDSLYIATGGTIDKLSPTGPLPYAVTAEPPVSMAADSAGLYWTSPDCRVLATHL